MDLDHWFTDHANIVILTSWMAREEAFNKEDMAYAVEKPWKYEEEFKEAVAEIERDHAVKTLDPTRRHG